MRIIMLCDRIPPENHGGAEKVAWTLARGLRDAGHEIHAIAATDRPDFEEVREGIATYHLHTRIPARLRQYTVLWNPQVCGKLKRLYTQIQPDIVSAWVIQNDLSFESIALAHRMGYVTVFNAQDVSPVSITRLTHYIDPARCDYPPDAYHLPRFSSVRHAHIYYNPLRYPVVRRILNRQVTARVAGSDALRQVFEANGLRDVRVVRASVNAADMAATPDEVEAVRMKLGLRGRKVILFAGRLTPDKGSHQMLAALRDVVRDVPDALLLMLTRASLAEQGLDAPQYQALLPHLKIGGWMQGRELAAAYHAADVVAVPSVCFDTFPTVNLEAMAAAKPVIATCFGGAREAVQDGISGFIVNPFDTATFANQLKRVLTDATLAAQMGAAGYQRAVTEFTATRFVREMVQVYHDAIARRR